MKKLSAVLLSILMALTCLVPMASAYDKAAVIGGDYSALEDDDVLGVVLDWLDSKIAAAAPDFDEFEQYAQFIEAAGYEIPEITGVDSLVAYKDHLAELGGDFAALTSTDRIVKRADAGNTGFVNGMIAFMAANADIFGKVFRWDDQVFDYGNVGKYIEENLEKGDPIRDFYENYLVGNNIQDKFIREIAREMNYAVPETRTETFDEIISNGIKAWALETFGELLNDDGKAAVAAYDLRTTDVYTLVKDFLYQVQNSNKAKLDDMLNAFMTAIQSSVAAIRNGINIEPPVLTVGHETNEAYATYHPADPDKENYMPSIYANDQAYDTLKDLADEETGVSVQKNAAMTDAEKALVAGAAEPWGEYFKAKATMGGDELLNLSIKLSDAEEAIMTQVIDRINAQPPTTIEAMGTSVSYQIKDAAATFSYKAYKDEANGSFAVQAKAESATAKVYITSPVTATADVDLMNPDNITIDWGSSASLIAMAKSFGIDVDQMIIDAVKNAVGDMLNDPALVTIVMTGLNGEIEDLAKVKELVDLIDTEAVYDPAVLDFFKDGRYDTYKGVVGQANRVFCDTLQMILSADGYESLALTEGDNSNLYGNMQKLCSKVDDMMAMMKKYLSGDDFAALAAAAGLGDDFASTHGFNAGMIYNMDFSSVENLLVCVIRLGCDMVVEDNSGLLYDIHTLVEDDETLDAMFAHVGNYFLKKAVAKLNANEAVGFTYNYTDITGTDKNAVYDKLADIAYEAAAWAVPKINNAVNGVIDKLNKDFDLGLGQVNFRLNAAKGETWNAVLAGLVERFLGLTDGLILYSGANTIADSDSALLKASKILNTVLPMSSMFSGTTDLVTIDGYVDNALNGDFGGLLRLFETKEDAIAGEVPVTKALINASDYIVDAFFPDTVQTELYPAAIDVQETFTANDSDQGIAARNMVSINNRKADLIPVACRLLKESDLLKSLACDHANAEATAVAATCTTAGSTGDKICPDCGAVLEKGEEIPAKGHNMVAGAPVAPTCTADGYTLYTCANGCGTTEKKDIVPATGHNLQLTASKDATCTEAGYKTYTCANGCGTTKTDNISAKGHSWNGGVVTKEATENEEGVRTYTCTVCGTTRTETIGKKSTNFFQRILNAIRGFFDRILSFFRNLF